MPPRKRRRKRSRSQRPSLPPNVQSAPSPRGRLKALLELLGEVAKAADRATFEFAQDETRVQNPAFRHDLSVLMRASNALKAIRLLSEAAHWEFAAGIVRQLFELAVNAEHIAASPDRDAAIFRHAKYAVLQTALRLHGNMRYAQQTGRPVDSEGLRTIEELLAHQFPADSSTQPGPSIGQRVGRDIQPAISPSSPSTVCARPSTSSCSPPGRNRPMLRLPPWLRTCSQPSATTSKTWSRQT